MAAGGLHGPADALRAHGIEGLEGEVFELLAELVHAQAASNGGVVVQGFPGNALFLFPRKSA